MSANNYIRTLLRNKLMSTPQRKEYYIIRKKEAFKMLRSGIKQSEVARILRVSDSTILSWKKELNENTTPKASKR